MDNTRSYLTMVIEILNRLGVLALLGSILPFSHYLVGLKPRKWLFILCLILVTSNFIIDIVFTFFIPSSVKYYFMFPVFWGIILYSCIIIGSRFRNIGEAHIKNSMKKMLIVTIIFIPLIILENIRPLVPVLQPFWIFELFSMPLFFLFLFPIFYTSFHQVLNQPAFVDNGKITTYFQSKYQITDRESEIIDEIMQGNTYKKIAENLFISVKTVDTHIQNIYKKTEVNSRLKLLNLINTNQ